MKNTLQNTPARRPYYAHDEDFLYRLCAVCERFFYWLSDLDDAPFDMCRECVEEEQRDERGRIFRRVRSRLLTLCSLFVLVGLSFLTLVWLSSSSDVYANDEVVWVSATREHPVAVVHIGDEAHLIGGGVIELSSDFKVNRSPFGANICSSKGGCMDIVVTKRSYLDSSR